MPQIFGVRRFPPLSIHFLECGGLRRFLLFLRAAGKKAAETTPSQKTKAVETAALQKMTAKSRPTVLQSTRSAAWRLRRGSES
jgi:hypothetical protein